MNKLLIALIVSILVGLVFITWATADQFTILHEFAGGADDGKNPRGSLTVSDSTIYGMTYGGGNTDQGVVFKMTAGNPSSFTLLHKFAGGADDGKNPYGSLTLSGSTLYGMTFFGGNYAGTIFRMEADNPSSYTLLHEFLGGGDDGEMPRGDITISGDTLYGMTYSGGSASGGTIFKMGTDNPSSFTLLHEFGGGANDGKTPYGSLALSGSTLYGMTYNGGISDNGVIFTIDTDTPASFTLLHKFASGANDGKDPAGGLIISGSTLYGMTESGGDSLKGVLFSIDTDSPSSFTLLHEFAGNPDGQLPFSDLTLSNGTLYGMTYEGGSYTDGTIFEVAADDPSSFTILHNFASGANDGSYPWGSLALVDSTLYGMTYTGGDSNLGVIFSMGVDGGGEVPEPSTILLLLPLLGGLWWMRRRRG
ncbi:choice-of-anchor tandem repeat GloVer-containing protein [Candidatus Auribacterota bacterium]